jgi:hypothetical protein
LGELAPFRFPAVNSTLAGYSGLGVTCAWTLKEYPPEMERRPAVSTLCSGHDSTEQQVNAALIGVRENASEDVVLETGLSSDTILTSLGGFSINLEWLLSTQKAEGYVEYYYAISPL